MLAIVNESCEVVHQEKRANVTDPTCGTIDQERFELWVEQKFCPVLGNYDCGELCSVVILDNATIHHLDHVTQLNTSCGATYLFLPPYSPDLNPIELIFGLYKHPPQVQL